MRRELTITFMPRAQSGKADPGVIVATHLTQCLVYQETLEAGDLDQLYEVRELLRSLTQTTNKAIRKAERKAA